METRSLANRLPAIWADRQQQRQRDEIEPQLPLPGGGGGDNSGGVEARLAKLEASMDHVKADLGRLAGVPADLARVAERLNHLPTKAEMTTDMETAIDRSGARIQRTVAVVGGLVALAIAAINFLPKLFH